MKPDTIKRWLKEQVTITPPGGHDDWGQPIPGTPVTVPARVEHNHKRSRTPEGEEFTSTTQVVTLAEVRVGDTITVDGAQRPVQAVKHARGLHGGASLTEAQL